MGQGLFVANAVRNDFIPGPSKKKKKPSDITPHARKVISSSGPRRFARAEASRLTWLFCRQAVRGQHPEDDLHQRGRFHFPGSLRESPPHFAVLKRACGRPTDRPTDRLRPGARGAAVSGPLAAAKLLSAGNGKRAVSCQYCEGLPFLDVRRLAIFVLAPQRLSAVNFI